MAAGGLLLLALGAGVVAQRGGATPADATEPPAAVRDSFMVARRLLAEGAPDRKALGVTLLEEVTRRSPRWAPGFGYLAGGLYAEGRIEEARAAAAEALRLDPGQPEALLTEGTLALLVDWRWDLAESLLTAGVERDPDGASLRTARAFVRLTAGRRRDALADLQRAREIEPLTAAVAGDLGRMFLYTGHLKSAALACEAALDREPEAIQARACAFTARLGRGDTAMALRHAAALRSAEGEGDHVVPAGLSNRAALEHFLGWRARRAKALLAADARQAFPAALSLAEAGLMNEALGALEQAARVGGPAWVTVTVDPRLAPLREHPTFVRLIEPVVRAGAAPPVTDESELAAREQGGPPPR